MSMTVVLVLISSVLMLAGGGIRRSSIVQSVRWNMVKLIADRTAMVVTGVAVVENDARINYFPLVLGACIIICRASIIVQVIRWVQTKMLLKRRYASEEGDAVLVAQTLDVFDGVLQFIFVR